MAMPILDEHKPDFEKVLEHLQHEAGTLRTGRASPALVEDLQVEAYGTTQPVKALGSMSTPDARTLVIEPWDASVVKAIESAIVASGIGVSPVVDGKIIRLIMPMMTEENRQKMVKVLNEKLEDARVHIRKIREEAKKKIEKQTGVGQDDIRRELEQLDKAVKDYVAKVDDIGDKKEKEIMTV
jgi:ribosome recycling factor